MLWLNKFKNTLQDCRYLLFINTGSICQTFSYNSPTRMPRICLDRYTIPIVLIILPYSGQEHHQHCWLFGYHLMCIGYSKYDVTMCLCCTAKLLIDFAVQLHLSGECNNYQKKCIPSTNVG